MRDQKYNGDSSIADTLADARTGSFVDGIHTLVAYAPGQAHSNRPRRIDGPDHPIPASIASNGIAGMR
jgi:hypothetical protein